VQSLNDSVDEVKSRLSKLQKSLSDLQAQLQTLQAPPQTQPAPGAPVTPGTQTPGAQGAQGAVTPAPAPNPAPPLDETFQAGLRDFNGARYQVAQGEFQDVIQYYPQEDLAGQAQFYLGEIAYRQQNYQDAVTAYNAVLESHANTTKAAAAQLHKGLALLAMNKRAAGIDELRALIHKHPQSPEADQARRRLAGMGVKATGPSR
jgi:TolA-binding protein